MSSPRCMLSHQNQLVDVFTKSLKKFSNNIMSSTSGVDDLYSLASGNVRIFPHMALGPFTSLSYASSMVYPSPHISISLLRGSYIFMCFVGVPYHDYRQYISISCYSD